MLGTFEVSLLRSYLINIEMHILEISYFLTAFLNFNFFPTDTTRRLPYQRRLQENRLTITSITAPVRHHAVHP